MKRRCEDTVQTALQPTQPMQSFVHEQVSSQLSSNCDLVNSEEAADCTEQGVSSSESDADSSEYDSDNVEIISDTEESVVEPKILVEAHAVGCRDGGLDPYSAQHRGETEASNQTFAPTTSPEVSHCKEQGGTAASQRQIQIISTHICLFITFFQLCYRISERGITILLSFLRTMFSWASTFSSSGELLILRDMIPKNVYFLKKICSSEKSLTTYVVCPRCHALYNLDDCIIRQRNGIEESARCTFVQYPRHPHPSRREKCNALLMKRTKHGSKYRLVPRKVYTYNSVKESLTKLFGKTDFSLKCERWRSRHQSPGMYTDVYDGLVWEKFQSVNGKPFLQFPNNLALILNVDWFNPFKHKIQCWCALPSNC